jgi:hypothetical protein
MFWAVSALDTPFWKFVWPYPHWIRRFENIFRPYPRWISRFAIGDGDALYRCALIRGSGQASDLG